MEELRQRIQRIQLQEANSDGSSQEHAKSYRCLTCKDQMGYLVKGEDGLEYWRECEHCGSSRKTERIMKQSRITDEFKTKSFGAFDLEDRPEIVKTAYEAAYDYAKWFHENKGKRRNSLALLGNPGCGKTHLCMAVANHLMRKGVPLIYFPWVEGFAELRNNLDELETRIGLMQRIDVLYIDDMWKGRKTPTEFQIEQAFAIINYRYLNNLPILVSSEFDIDAMCEFDEATATRIFEMSKDHCVVVHGDRKQLNYRLA
ncbi:ATP-binding protein [Cohnella xylanilytica]|uniref:ATP-binding protein n=1 Tax=Cohnella xylanilytica TaxID=557555 RepID=A0A841U1U8_9BACL|nr:ATP-binding protein [Cohnella xylanilytica]